VRLLCATQSATRCAPGACALGPPGMLAASSAGLACIPLVCRCPPARGACSTSCPATPAA